MVRSTLSIEQIMTTLAETPRRIGALTAGVAPGHLRQAPSDDEWSANDVLAHLRACADVWGGTIVRIVKEDGPVLRAVSPVTWLKSTDYPELQFGPSLRAFTRQRAKLLELLRGLRPRDWSRTATMTGAGRVLPRVVQIEASELARHERTHVKQIERIVATLS